MSMSDLSTLTLERGGLARSKDTGTLLLISNVTSTVMRRHRLDQFLAPKSIEISFAVSPVLNWGQVSSIRSLLLRVSHLSASSGGGGLKATVNFLGTRQIYCSACYTGPENPDVKNTHTHNQAAHTAQPGRTFLTIQLPLLFAPTLRFLPNTHSPTESSPTLVEE